MSLLDRIKLRAAPELPDAELNAMIDAITAEIDVLLGPVGAITVHLGDSSDPETSFNRTLRLPRPMMAGQPIAITERDPGNSGNAQAAFVLAPADYRILHNGRTLQRLTTGPMPRAFWAPLVEVTYTPTGVGQMQRDEAVIKVMQLDLTYRGLIKSERAGDYQWSGSVSADSYMAERGAIFSSLVSPSGMVLA